MAPRLMPSRGSQKSEAESSSKLQSPRQQNGIGTHLYFYLGAPPSTFPQSGARIGPLSNLSIPVLTRAPGHLTGCSLKLQLAALVRESSLVQEPGSRDSRPTIGPQGRGAAWGSFPKDCYAFGGCLDFLVEMLPKIQDRPVKSKFQISGEFYLA